MDTAIIYYPYRRKYRDLILYLLLSLGNEMFLLFLKMKNFTILT